MVFIVLEKSRWLLVHNSVRQTVVPKCMDEYLEIGNGVLSLSDPVSSSGCCFKRIIIWWLICKNPSNQLARYLTKSRPVTEIPFACHPPCSQ